MRCCVLRLRAAVRVACLLLKALLSRRKRLHASDCGALLSGNICVIVTQVVFKSLHKIHAHRGLEKKGVGDKRLCGRVLRNHCDTVIVVRWLL